ncbi:MULTISPECIES: phosphonate ABC transporter ATP-binding protein [unclassified Adlercreutzia]|uniref:phosphonate ABC transporter ATP-binding protein n=1 Tax=unclassified Adlercreutzia TaxID=2636013 RepID=UPI0013EB9D85|nr:MULTISPECIES: phosphonate ABC transporter ATP-binding protein [unclassified Adlercreutzia]
MQEESPLLAVSHLTKSYDGWSRALDDVTFSLRRGEFVSIIGSSGAGKSTFLRCVNRLVVPTSGVVEFDGREVCTASRRELRALRRRIAMVFQHYNLVGRSTAVENVLQGRLGYKSALAGSLGIFTEEEKHRAFQALEQVGLSDFAYARADSLSGGQKQRVGIARSLVQDPLLMLADEPIASLDPKSSRTVMDRLRWAADELGIACLVNLHQVDFALEYSDRIIALSGGRKVFDGVPSELDDATVKAIYDGNHDSAQQLAEAEELAAAEEYAEAAGPAAGTAEAEGREGAEGGRPAVLPVRPASLAASEVV